MSTGALCLLKCGELYMLNTINQACRIVILSLARVWHRVVAKYLGWRMSNPHACKQVSRPSMIIA